ncbi:MAG: peptide MFS transporter [Firmicutes bacterium]|nr:peptide MFS transporter [Bacillota bacterium]
MAETINGSKTEKHPPGLYVLFSTEMWERFGFYTMLAMFTLYLKDSGSGFGWATAKAVSLYSTYIMFLYATPLIGGVIADKFLGYRNSVTLGGIFLTAGYFLLTVKNEHMLYAALVCIIIGNGFFKPNVSTMLGNLYPEGSKLKDSGYNIFYVGINVGALMAPIAAEILKVHYGFNIAFGAAAIGMIISLIVFCSNKRNTRSWDEIARKNGTTEKDRKEQKQWDKCDVPPIELVPERKRILALIVIFVVVIVFWMIFHQNGSTLTIWADENTDWKVSGIISNAINPFWIITLTFPLVWFWKKLAEKGKEPGTVTKIFFGMLLTSLSFFIMYLAAKSGGDHGKVSPLWLIGSYMIISLGELMLSPMGLSLVSKAAPKHLRGLMMGGWFLATAIGNKLTAIGQYWEVWSHSRFFLILSLLALGTAFFLLIIMKPLKKALPGV